MTTHELFNRAECLAFAATWRRRERAAAAMAATFAPGTMQRQKAAGAVFECQKQAAEWEQRAKLCGS